MSTQSRALRNELLFQGVVYSDDAGGFGTTRNQPCAIELPQVRYDAIIWIGQKGDKVSEWR